ncbi:MAG: tRNA epoxyqueuosine(34) reductase QueG, partial [Bacteriovorax sp.]|nr:tRNA epoxyqueuosine(34) reductase QueG [Rhizobacter sp.]
KYARVSGLPDFDAREAVSGQTLLALWAWTEADFLRHTEGSAIRRIGFERWQRNLAVAMGNALRAGGAADNEAPRTALQRELQTALRDALPHASGLVTEHIGWALEQALEPAPELALSAATPAPPARPEC